MPDELRRYAPTARRLEKLRQAGAGAHSPALTAATVLVATVVIGAGVARPLGRELARSMAVDLGAPLWEARQLPALLGRHLVFGGALVVAVAALALLAASLAHALQAGGLTWSRQGAGKPFKSPLSPPDGPGVVLALAALAAGVLAYGAVLGYLKQAALGSPAASAEIVGAAGLRWLCLLGGLGLLHLLWVRSDFLRRAMLTHRDLQEEHKEAEGSWLKGRLLQIWRARDGQQRRTPSA
jgi:flagellar biosynthesis protein FlhB